MWVRLRRRAGKRRWEMERIDSGSLSLGCSMRCLLLWIQRARVGLWRCLHRPHGGNHELLFAVALLCIANFVFNALPSLGNDGQMLGRCIDLREFLRFVFECGVKLLFGESLLRKRDVLEKGIAILMLISLLLLLELPLLLLELRAPDGIPELLLDQ
jgi:hypothetical protein